MAELDFSKITKDPLVAKKIMDYLKQLSKEFGPIKNSTIEIFEDMINYDEKQVVELALLANRITFQGMNDQNKRQEMIEEFEQLKSQIKKKDEIQKRIYLWQEGNMPQKTKYEDNSEYKYNHNPDFKPYMFELLVDRSVRPKGAVIVCPGGDHGDCVVYEGYGVCKELNAIGYQCFLLNNRTNMNPWSQEEAGADVARAITYVRKNAEKYRIEADRVAFAGFSNGGLTGEANIRFYSNGRRISDVFKNYQEDEQDEYDGSMDVFLNIYGPRFKKQKISYRDIKYPPVFLAVGEDDKMGIENLLWTYADLKKHDVKTEMHTFTGVGHGKAGEAILGITENENFRQWIGLADTFMQKVYEERNQR